nr:hypothetical protein [Streptomyces sp. TS71-3]
MLAVGLAALLFATAAGVGTYIEHTRHTLFLGWPPLFASWDPHLGPGTPAALAVAAAVVAYGPSLAARLPWRALLPAAWATALAWTLSLALVDGWHRGVARRLTTGNEYLQSVGSFHHVGPALRDFTHHILLHSPHHWPAHVAGHPPAATLTFVWLDHLGLHGGGWAAVFVLVTGTSAVAAALVALRALAGEDLARRAVPFLVLVPMAVWAGVSADAYFSAVAAWALALLALAATRTTRAPAACALGAGLLLGLTCYLSYGLTLIAVPAAAILLLTRTLRPLPFAVLGAAVVPVAFTVAGFDWWEAYRLLVTRYDEGAGGVRPYGYWIWANLACTALIVGPAVVAGLRRVLAAAPGAASRVVRDLGGRRARAADADPARVVDADPARVAGGVRGVWHVRGVDAVVVLALAGLAAVLLADLSGMSKAETERIWQPFALWLLPAAVLLPAAARRRWLVAQACVALVVNHLLLTGW